MGSSMGMHPALDALAGDHRLIFDASLSTALIGLFNTIIWQMQQLDA